MKIIIVGGGIAAVYIANRLLDNEPSAEVLIISNETFHPYDRIHLCSLVDRSCQINDIALKLNPKVQEKLNCEIVSIDPDKKTIYSHEEHFTYDHLIIATGSKPKELFDITNLSNATTFRSAHDCNKISEGIKDKNVVIMGVGPIGLELLDTLMTMPDAKSITLLSRGEHLYDKELNHQSVKLIQEIFEKDPRVSISFDDTIIKHEIKDNQLISLQTKKTTISDPFLIFGVGIEPNIAFAKDAIKCHRGIMVNEKMQSSNPYIYAVGEAAEVADDNFIAGRVKECTLQADVAISNILDKDPIIFDPEISIDGLKVGSFYFSDVTSPHYQANNPQNEVIIIASQKEKRVDQYILNDNKLMRFIGVNTNIDQMHLKELMQKQINIDASYLYENRVALTHGKLICSCTASYENDLIELIHKHHVTQFSDLKTYSEAGRICGRCKKDVTQLIAQEAGKKPLAMQESPTAEKRDDLDKVRKRIAKYNALHPDHLIDESNLEEAIQSFDLNQEFNRWVSMVTASLRLHPDYEGVLKESVENLHKVPVIWLELADCSGNSEAFIKSAHPTIDELILNHISLDYHELLMSGSGDQSETMLDSVIKNDAGNYILIVEGAIPMAMDGKYLRIGPKGETGIELLRRAAKGAKAIMAVGSCAFDGGVVAIEPNPTGAVGVSEALQRDDIIKLPGCPTNPINVVGTLLHYMMFDEFPPLDDKNRPVWAYSQRIHDNCERRGHYDLDEFVLEWGDEGAKKGWCLFKMGCKGPYADLNCSLVKFNEGTNWPVQVGHGCFGCGLGKDAFEHLANNREISEKYKNIILEKEKKEG